jgi:hypothetical protein
LTQQDPNASPAGDIDNGIPENIVPGVPPGDGNQDSSAPEQAKSPVEDK